MVEEKLGDAANQVTDDDATRKLPGERSEKANRGRIGARGETSDKSQSQENRHRIVGCAFNVEGRSELFLDRILPGDEKNGGRVGRRYNGADHHRLEPIVIHDKVYRNAQYKSRCGNTERRENDAWLRDELQIRAGRSKSAVKKNEDEQNVGDLLCHLRIVEMNEIQPVCTHENTDGEKDKQNRHADFIRNFCRENRCDDQQGDE